jgi:hypothetical protein
MKRRELEDRKRERKAMADAARTWKNTVLLHPVPAIQEELLAAYNGFSHHRRVKQARFNVQDFELVANDADQVLVWQSPTSELMRYGPHALTWPVCDEHVWPLTDKTVRVNPDLSKDLWSVIFRFCTPRALLALRLVNTKFRALVCDPGAEWWTRRRDALLAQCPDMILPQALWMWYARWEAVEAGKAVHRSDYRRWLRMSLPPGISGVGFGCNFSVTDFPDMTKQTGKPREFSQISGAVNFVAAGYDRQEHVVLSMHEKRTGNVFVVWRLADYYEWASFGRRMPWDTVTKPLLDDRAFKSSLCEFRWYRILLNKTNH